MSLPERAELPSSADPTVVHGAGVAAVAGYAPETKLAPGYLSHEFVAAHETKGTWVEIGEGEDAFVTCSDDRPVTEQSAAELLRVGPENMRDPREVTISVFGGLSGATKAVLVAGVALYGEGFIQTVGGFHGVMDQLVRRGDGSFTEHTAEGAEGNPAQFEPYADTPVGCAYNQLLGTTAVLLGKRYPVTTEPEPDSLIQAVGRQNQIDMFGSDRRVDALMAANHILTRHLASLTPDGTPEGFSVDRRAYAKLHATPRPTNPDAPAVPIVVLAGHHKPAAETGVISNFAINQGGRPGEIYRLDIARTTQEVMKALPEYGLPAEMLMRAMQLDSAPVRAALYSHDPSHGGGHGPLDPNGLPMAWRGDPWAAIHELDAQYRAHKP